MNDQQVEYPTFQTRYGQVPQVQNPTIGEAQPAMDAQTPPALNPWDAMGAPEMEPEAPPSTPWVYQGK